MWYKPIVYISTRNFSERTSDVGQKPQQNGLSTSTAKNKKQEIPSYFKWDTADRMFCQIYMCCFQPRHPLDAKGIRFVFLAAMPRSETHRGFHSKQGLGCKGKKRKAAPLIPRKSIQKSHKTYIAHKCCFVWCKGVVFFFWDFKFLFENSGIQGLPWNISGMCIFSKGSGMESK